MGIGTGGGEGICERMLRGGTCGRGKPFVDIKVQGSDVSRSYRFPFASHHQLRSFWLVGVQAAAAFQPT